MKKEINVFDHANEILTNLKRGVLLNTKTNSKFNTMTISWGTIGIEWNKPIFTTFVRQHRFTHEQLEVGDAFTVSIPYGEFRRQILGIAGTRSGYDVDKVAELGLHLEEPMANGVPGIKELPLTLECRLIYKQLQDRDAIPEDIRKRDYPEHVPGTFHGANCDYHTAYVGEIVAAYIIED